MRKWFFGMLVLGGILKFAGAVSAAGVQAADMVAQIDTFKITVADLHMKLEAISPGLPEKNFEQRKNIALNELIIERLVGFQADSIPLEKDTNFARNTSHLLRQIANRVFMNQAVLSLVSVGDSEVYERYREKPEEYQMMEWVRTSHILVTPVKDTTKLTSGQKETGWWAGTDEKAKSIADSLYRAIQSGASFEALAQKWSQDGASASQGGDLNRMTRGQMVPEFDSAAFSLPPGTVSPPLKTKFGYHLIKVTERQEKMTAPMSDSLKNAITAQIRNERAMARAYSYLDSLQQAGKVVFNEGLVEKADSFLALPDSVLRAHREWAAVSSYGDTIWSSPFFARLVSVQQMEMGPPLERGRKLDLLKSLMNPHLILRAMKDTRVEESEEFLKEKERIYLNEKLVRARQGARLSGYTPSEEEIRSCFESHRPEFPRRDTLAVKVQQIVLKSRREADQAHRETLGDSDFFAVAKRHYTGDSAMLKESFNLGWISPPAMPKSLFDVAETLAVGVLSRPVKTEWGYHLIKVLERRPDLTFDFARPEIVNRLRKAKQEEHKRKWEAELRAGHQIKINDRLLKKIKDPALEKLSSDGGN